VRVLDWLDSLDEPKRDAAIRGLRIEGAAVKLRAVVEEEVRLPPAGGDDGFECGDDDLAEEAMRCRDGQAFAGAAIDLGEAPEVSAIAELVTHEIEAPRLVRTHGGGARDTGDG